MKRLIIILAILLMPVWAWGASITKTVCASGCDYTTVKGAVDYIRLNGDGTSANYINIGAGTYSSANDYAAIENAKLVNLTITGAGRTLTILNPSGADVINVSNGNGLVIKDLTIKPQTVTSDAFECANGTDTITIQDVDFVAPAGFTRNLILNQGDTVNCTRCRFFHEYDATNYRNPIRLTNDASGTFNYCLSMAAGHVEATTIISIESTGTVAFNNCLIFDSQSHGISFSGAGTFSMSNCIVAGSTRNATGVAIIRSAGTLTLSNNLVISNPWDGDGKWISGTYSDGGGNLITSVNPKFVRYPRRGYILPRIDDAANFAYAQSVATLLAAKSMKGSYFIEQKNWNASNNADLRTMVSTGVMEVAQHSYSHSDLSKTGKLWDVTKAAETITIDRTAGTIVLSGGGTVSGFKAKTLAAIKLELEGFGATVTGSAIFSATDATGKINDDALGEVIANGVATNQIDLLVTDETEGLFKSEIADPKTWLATTIVNGAGNVTDGQTGLTYVANSFGFPYNASSAGARTAGIAAGYTSLSSGKIGGAGTIVDVPYLGDIDMYAIVDVASTYLQGSNEANTRYNARALAFAASHTGLVIGVLCHNTTECSTDTWTYAIDEWSKYGADFNVTSRQLFRAAIAASHTDDLDGTYSKTFTNGDADWSLQSGSPAINSGVVVAGVHPGTDYAGNPNYKGAAPDIGAYESQKIGGLMQQFNRMNRFAPHRRLH